MKTSGVNDTGVNDISTVSASSTNLNITHTSKDASAPPIKSEANELEIPFTIFNSMEKRCIVYISSFAAMFSGVCGYIYYPAMVPLARDLNVSVQLINLSVTAYIIMGGIAPAFMGDIADQTGRRPVYVVTYLFLVGGNLGLALQSDYATLLVLRCVQAVGASSMFSIAHGVISDIVTPAERGGYTGTIVMFTTVAPSAAPIIGGAIGQGLGWRGIFWFVVILTALHFLVTLLILPETQRKVVGNGTGRTTGLYRSLFSSNLEARSKLTPGGLHPEILPGKRKHHIPNPFACLPVLMDKNSACSIFIGAIFYATSRAMGASLAAKSVEVYNFNILGSGLVYIPSGVAGIIASRVTGKFIDHNYRVVAKRVGIDITPKRGRNIDLQFPLEEARLRWIQYLILISVVATAGYGWSLKYETHIAIPLLMQFLTGLTFTSLFTITNTLLGDFNPHRNATAAASGNLVRNTLAGAAVALLEVLEKAVGLGWCFTLYAAALCVVMGPVGLLRCKGKQWRRENREKETRIEEEKALKKARKDAES